ncbi:MAG: hypothetical protein V1834_03625, partial [Candidatus Micrarchaeota archaeon]
MDFDSDTLDLTEGKKNLITLFLIGIVLLALIWIFFPQSNETTATIKVTSGSGEPLDGVVVRAYANGEFIDAIVTKNGVAVFEGLPRDTISFKLAKDNYAAKSIDLDLREIREASVSMSGVQPTYSSLEVTVVSASDGGPVEGARVVYEAGELNGVASTDANGFVLIEEIGSDGFVSLKITKDGFEENTLSILALRQKATVRLKEIQAEKQIQEYRNELSFSDNGFVLVSVRGPGGETPAGSALLYLESGTLVGEATLTNGQATFENTPIGVNAFVTVNADGFPPFNGESHAKQLEEFTSFSVLLEETAKSTDTTIKVSSDSGKVSATVFLMPAYSTVVLAKKTGVDKEWTLKVAEGSYYAVAVANGFLSARTPLFEAGAVVSINLRKATDVNSGSLKVTVLDEYAAPVKNAVVKISSTGLFVLPEEKTDSQGTAKFGELEEGSYEVSAFYAGKEAAARALVSAGEEASVNLILPLFESFIAVRSFDYSSNQAIENAEFKFYQEDEQVASCAMPECKVAIKAFKPTKIIGSASGYESYEASETLKPGEEIVHDAYLIKSAEVEAGVLTVEFLGWDSAEIKAGEEYSARLLITAPLEATTISAYLRVGSMQTIGEEPAGISGHENGIQVQKSSRYSGVETSCVDLSPEFINGDENGLFKWVMVSFDASGTREVKFKIKTKSDSAEKKFKLYYRAEAQTQSTTMRQPEDDFNIAKADCYANAVETSEFEILAGDVIPGPSTQPGASPTPSVEPEPTTVPPNQFTASFTPTAEFRVENGEVKASVAEIVFQIDSVLPGDAVPID